MPRIKLAYWHGGHAPGDEVDVSDEEFAALSRDGRVAERVQEEPAEQAPTVPEQQPDAQPEATVSESGRKRR